METVLLLRPPIGQHGTEASWERAPGARPSARSAERSMAAAGTDVWVSTFAQLMSERKPRDAWVLLPQESLAAGPLDGSSFQYRLKGLSRLQCSRCLWVWRSAHVHILFHLWWDAGSRQGLVKMRVWGQQCRMCPPGPPGPRGDCQVSPLNVWIFLSKLVLHILRRCYGDTLSHCPEVRFGDRCEACELQLCFLQKAPELAWAPPPRPRHAPGCCAHEAGCATVPLLVTDFVEEPLSQSSDFLFEGAGVVTLPFALADADAGGGTGTLCLFAEAGAVPEAGGFPVDVRDPVLRGEGLLLSDVDDTFQMRGFVFGARDGAPRAVSVARGRGPLSVSAGLAAPPPAVSYVVGLAADGEGALSFPWALLGALGRAGGPGAEGSVTFPFCFAEGVDNGREPLPPAPGAEEGAPAPVPVSRGSITVPFAALEAARRLSTENPAGGAQGGGFVGYSYCRRRTRALAHEEDEPRACAAPRRPRAEPSEDFWIWVSMTVCIFWLMCMCRLNFSIFQQPA